MKNKMNIAVTGSSGFIGYHLVNRLNVNKYNVTTLDLKNNIDITKWEHIKNIKEVDLIFHLAAKNYIPYAYKKPRDFYATNIMSTLNMLEICRKLNAKMVYISSYVYGEPKNIPINEKQSIKATNPYARSKIICENMCSGYSKDFGVKVIIIRPFNVYGVQQSKNFLIPSIIEQIKTKREIVLKDPSPKRDFVYIDDLIDALIKSINLKNRVFDVFNIGSGISYSINEIVNLITDKFKYPIRVKYTGEKRINEISDTVADISKAKKILKWKPKINFNRGIEKIIHHEFCSKNNNKSQV